VLKLPRLQNPEAFAEQIDEYHWQLRLTVTGPTQHFDVQEYNHESINRWLDNVFTGNCSDVTELLVLGHENRFTISIYQPA
jgi:uncharacterized Fe-S cluster-containing protein